MRHLFSAVGLHRIQRLAALPSALIFDLDGTLAPIVAHHSDAKVPVQTARLLAALSGLWPVAIITGRSVNDARSKLGFTPDYLFGNHGAERTEQPVCCHLSEQLNACRQFLNHHSLALEARHVCVEDKGLSLALHYRQCDNPAATRAWLHELIGPLSQGIVVTDGDMVINILVLHAPDKGDAMLAILQDCGAVTALVVGDDNNDEAAFIKAPAGAVTVRIGPPAMCTHARFRLTGQYQINLLLTILWEQKRLQSQTNCLPKAPAIRSPFTYAAVVTAMCQFV